MLIGYNDGYGIYPTWHMLKRHIMAIQYLQKPPDKPSVIIHHALINTDNSKILMTSYPCNDCIFLRRRFSSNCRSRISWVVSVPDVDWDSGRPYRINCILMKYGSSHI